MWGPQLLLVEDLELGAPLGGSEGVVTAQWVSRGLDVAVKLLELLDGASTGTNPALELRLAFHGSWSRRSMPMLRPSGRPLPGPGRRRQRSLRAGGDAAFRSRVPRAAPGERDGPSCEGGRGRGRAAAGGAVRPA